MRSLYFTEARQNELLLGAVEVMDVNTGNVTLIPKAFASKPPCPPRGAVPVNQGCFRRSFTLDTRFAFGNGSDCPGYVGDGITG